MASNKELMADIVTLCTERSVPVPDGLENLKNGRLLELLDSLRQAPSTIVETALRPLVAPSPPAEPPDPAPETPAAVATPPVAVQAAAAVAAPVLLNGVAQTRYFVAEGKVVQGASDPRGAFEQITARDLAGGQEALDALVASGFVTTR